MEDSGSSEFKRLASGGSIYSTLEIYSQKASAVPKTMTKASEASAAPSHRPGGEKNPAVGASVTPPMSMPQPTTRDDGYRRIIAFGCTV